MPFVGIGVGIGRQRFGGGIFAAYAARVAADGGVTEAGACVNAVSGISLNSSLLLVPSGYKSGVVYSQIPTNGDGDLTFTRASDATRVNSDGLIEKVRTNLILQSNQFDTTWTNLNTAETSGQSGYDGTSNAWLLEKSASGGYLRQTGLTANAANFSVFVKANDSDYVLLAADFGTRTVYFDLQNGVVGNTSAGVTATIVFISNGWYRCSASFSAISDVRIYPAENNVVSASSGSVFIQNAQLETGDIATDYIPTTTTAVSVGMTANVPRLDYSQGSCPSLLLEPQRTNLLLRSEEFDNAYWVKTNTTLTANTIISPDGNTNAETFTINSGSTQAEVSKSLTTVTGTTYVFSCFGKKGSGSTDLNSFRVVSGALNVTTVTINWDTGVISQTGGSGATSENFGNGWYRIIIPFVANSTTTIVQLVTFQIYPTSVFSYRWGAQLEEGAYATSYIPTTSATVTRLRDRCIKTNFTGLSSQSELTLYAEFVYNQSGRIIAIGNGTSSNRLFFSSTSTKQIQLYLNVGGTAAFFLSSANNVLLNGKNKVAVKIKSGETLLYVNGVEIFNNTTTFTLANLNNIYIGTNEFSDSDNGTQYINSSLIFYSALTNSELATLTTL